MFSKTPFFSEYRARFEKHAFFFIDEEILQKYKNYTSPLLFLMHFSVQLTKVFGYFMVFGGIKIYSELVNEFCQNLSKTLNEFNFRQEISKFQITMKLFNQFFGPIILFVTLQILPMLMIWSTEMFYLPHREVSIREKMAFLYDLLAFCTVYGIAGKSLNKVFGLI